jgi:hypothetical protein
VGQEEDSEGVRQEDSEGGGQEDSEGVGGGGQKDEDSDGAGQEQHETWRVWARSTTVASRTTREGSVMGLLQARPPDTAGLGGATWSPLL